MGNKLSVVKGNEDDPNNEKDLIRSYNVREEDDRIEEDGTVAETGAKLSSSRKQSCSDKISQLNVTPSTVSTITDKIYMGTFSSSLPTSDENGKITDVLEIVKEKLSTLQLDGMDFIDELRSFINGSPEMYMTPLTVLKSYGDKLTPYEIMEISQYKRIYNFGINAQKGANIPGMNMNSEYDNVEHFYKFIEHDHIAYRYEIFEKLGCGSFGDVIRAYDHKMQEYVAIKISKNKPRYSMHAEKEIRMLQFVRKRDLYGNENFVIIKNAFTFRNHTCMVLELLSLNLHQLLKRNSRGGFSFELTQKFASSLLKSLKFLSRYKILHGDIKPANIIKCYGSNTLKLSDFGLSTFVRPKKPLTNHRFQTLWYRAPEVLLGGPYGIEADMWGFGCVVAEMIMGIPLFPGEDECDQMALLIEMFGLPPANIIKKSRRKNIFFKDDGTPLYFNLTDHDQAAYMAGKSPSGKRRGHPGSKSLAIAIGDNNLELLDFIEKCLTWDPIRRMTPQAALRHSFMTKKIFKPPNETQETIPLRLCINFSLSAITHLYEAAFPSSLKPKVGRFKSRAHAFDTAEARHSAVDSDLSGF